MDFRIGAPPPVGPPGTKTAQSAEQIEAQVLAIRPARSRSRPASTGQDRRGTPSERDPLGGRVLLLLIPQAHRLPEDLASGDYRVFLRIAKK